MKSKDVNVVTIKDDKEFKNYILENKPILASTHFTKNRLEILKEMNIPIVETIHNMYMFFNENEWNIEKKRAMNFTKQIAVSNQVKKYYQKHNNVDNITIIPNSSTLHKWHGINKTITRKIYNIALDDMVFIHLGSVEPRKNQLSTILAFEMFYKSVTKKAKLFVVGNTEISEQYNDLIYNTIKHLECKNNITFIKNIKDTSGILSVTSAFVMPSYFEGWSIAATESLFEGTPIIHSMCGSAEELCINDNGIIISNPLGDAFNTSFYMFLVLLNNIKMENVKELYKAMVKMYKKRDENEKNREIIRSTAMKDYSFDKMIDKYIEVFEEVGNKDGVSNN